LLGRGRRGGRSIRGIPRGVFRGIICRRGIITSRRIVSLWRGGGWIRRWWCRGRGGGGIGRRRIEGLGGVGLVNAYGDIVAVIKAIDWWGGGLGGIGSYLITGDGDDLRKDKGGKGVRRKGGV